MPFRRWGAGGGGRDAGGAFAVIVEQAFATWRSPRRFHFFFIPPPRGSEHLDVAPPGIIDRGASSWRMRCKDSNRRHTAPRRHRTDAREQDAFEPDRTVEMKVTFKTRSIPPAALLPAAPRDRPLFPDRRDVAARGDVALWAMSACLSHPATRPDVGPRPGPARCLRTRPRDAAATRARVSAYCSSRVSCCVDAMASSSGRWRALSFLPSPRPRRTLARALLPLPSDVLLDLDARRPDIRYDPDRRTNAKFDVGT